MEIKSVLKSLRQNALEELGQSSLSTVSYNLHRTQGKLDLIDGLLAMLEAQDVAD